MKLIGGLLLLLFQSCALCEKSSVKDSIQCLNQLPKENILASPAVKNYLSHHKVYITYSTSPSRLPKSIAMLKTLDLEYVDKIFIALPEKYRNTELYGPIPEEILNFPKLEVIARDQKDLGPIMKMLPAIEKVGPIDPDAIVISVDDDIGYPSGAIGQLIKYAILYPHAVVSGAGSYAELFGIKPHEWPADPMTKKAPYCGRGEISYCNFLEGYRGIAYKPRLVNTRQMAEMAMSNKSCKTSDDLVIGYVLALNHVERIRISNQYFNDIYRFEFGTDTNALHKTPTSRQDNWRPHWSWESFMAGTTHSERYQRCIYELKVKQKT